MNFPKADKKFGQHYLKSKKIIDLITTAPSDFNANQFILEIGPGPGVLTHNLFKLSKNFYVIEKDHRFFDLLNSILAKDHIFLEDALEFDWKHFSFIDTPIWLVSNLPYNISAPLTIKFLKYPKIKWMNLMYQKEVAFKILAPDKKNNTLHMLCKNYFNISSLVNVPPGAFAPPPKVKSEVISFTRKDSPLVALSEFSQFENFGRKFFINPRKQLLGNLKLHWPSEKIIDSFDFLNIDHKIRAEDLSYEQTISFYRHLYQASDK